MSKSIKTIKKYSLLFFVIVVVTFSCDVQKKSPKENTKELISSAQLSKNKVIKPENGFNSGLLDSKGNLWFGSNGNGIYKFDGNTFENFTEEDGLSNNQVYSIIEDEENNLWFGTQNGISMYDRNKFMTISIPIQDTTSAWLDKVYPVISPNAVHALAQDKNGDIWIGTGGGGAYHYDGKKFTSHLSEIGTKQEDSLYHNWIPSIMEDKKGNIWFASMTHGGVSRYDGETFTQFIPEDGLSDDMVRTIFKDKSGKIWLGFNGNRKSGLTVYDGIAFSTFSKEDGLCNTNIRAIYEDKKGMLWLGSGRGNLCDFDGKRFREFSSKEGKTFSRVLFILEDKNRNIWYGGKNGLWKFDGETVTNLTK